MPMASVATAVVIMIPAPVTMLALAVMVAIVVPVVTVTFIVAFADYCLVMTAPFWRENDEVACSAKASRDTQDR